MPVLRLLLLMGIAGVLLLFAMQNWAPPMQLVFLGLRSPAFPLALWILGAIAAGIVTTLLLSGLFNLVSLTASPRRRRRASPRPSESTSGYYPPPRTPDPPQSPRTTWQSPAAQSSASRSTTDDEWDLDDASDWFDDEPTDRSRDRTSSDRRSQTSYSYGYRDPGTTGVGKAEPVKPQPVVDADYRVIVPPYRKLDENDPDLNSDISGSDR